MTLDRRLHAYREDLADERLEGRVTAERFVAGKARLVGCGVADLRRRPSHDAPLDAQIWYGERVRLFESRAGWAWVQAERDGYVGYTPLPSLAAESPAAPSHLVSALMTFRFPEPSVKAPPLDRLPLGALLRAETHNERFLALDDGGYVFSRHTSGLDRRWPDWPATALRLLGVPYLWGGRSCLGVDCSGLVQMALLLAGRQVPRDSDMLREHPGLGSDLPPDAPRQRGDLLFSPGHVVIALDGSEIVHANAHHLAVEREPFEDFRQRLAGLGEGVTLLRRPR